MINKLKYKFILISMILVTSVLVFIVTAITFLTTNNQYNSTKEALSDAVKNADMLLNNGAQDDVHSKPDAFYALYYADEHKTIELENYVGEINDATRTVYFNSILQADNDTGYIIKDRILYCKRSLDLPSGETAYYIAFSPVSLIFETAESTLINSTIVASMALGILFLICRKLANVVTQPVEEAWDNQKRFIADASHDLKTPLTVIMANNEILMSHPDSTIESQQKWLESTKAEGEYMKSLVDRMLELARTETISDKLELSEIDISELTEGIILQLEPIAFDSGVTINSRITPEIVLKTNPSELSRLIHILVDNAIKYSHEGNEVSVFLIYNKKDIELCVNNRGDIIPKESLAHIFDRFYRTDDARTKGGFGLGLSIAKNITSALGGQISASSSEENGTTFSVRFKR